MDRETFWEIIATACRPGPNPADEWAEHLEAGLAQLSAHEIVEWNHLFDRMAARAYTFDLWGAAYIINGGASDDGFYYFRCWLICMGREVYEAAIADPDSLAGVVEPGIVAEAETYSVAHQAWMAVTGHSDVEPYPALNEDAELLGEDWDYDDNEAVRRRLPRLSALYLR